MVRAFLQLQDVGFFRFVKGNRSDYPVLVDFRYILRILLYLVDVCFMTITFGRNAASPPGPNGPMLKIRSQRPGKELKIFSKIPVACPTLPFLVPKLCLGREWAPSPFGNWYVIVAVPFFEQSRAFKTGLGSLGAEQSNGFHEG
jgi:hypothetical protein